ncbi:hypothetical protein Syun_029881 [Stephania yunnanensis]|uniref:Uncharacterized protein n=1 Tax=Stephania yunnanensis TaxID=152371 RepID=A0AAP0E9R5_9MAGN
MERFRHARSRHETSANRSPSVKREAALPPPPMHRCRRGKGLLVEPHPQNPPHLHSGRIPEKDVCGVPIEGILSKYYLMPQVVLGVPDHSLRLKSVIGPEWRSEPDEPALGRGQVDTVNIRA